MSVQIQMRRGTAAQWTTANTLLAEGEIGLELDTQKFKMGTGVLAWNSLSYYTAGASTVTSVNGQTGAAVLDTDDIAEGAVNKYFANSLARGAVSAAGSLSYNSTTGVFSYTQPTNVSTFTNDANYLDNADIGVSVQGYNASTVVDASYVHTDNNYTTIEKNKLAGIAAGAEVNVNADWTAVTGDAVILNKPTLGTAAATASTDYATAAQGTKADSALQPASIGVTVQAYDTDLAAWAGVATTAKQDTLVSGTNIKTINGNTLLGSGDLVISGGGGSSALTISNKTAAYTVVAGDLGTIINCTSGTFTVSLTAAATLGAGFNATVWNTSATATDAITIDPSGAETVDGSATLVLQRGEGMQIVCDGTNWQTGDKKTMRGYAENFAPSQAKPTASGTNSLSIGVATTATATGSVAVGRNANATGNYSAAFGSGFISNVAAVSAYSTAVGNNSGGNGSQAVTGSGAMALGGSYASGTDSFAAAVANNTSSYGAKAGSAVAIGKQVTASGSDSVAIGYYASASNQRTLALVGATASGTNSIALGENAISNAIRGVAFQNGNTRYYGHFVHSPYNSTIGQSGLGVLLATTTDTTSSVLTANNTTANSTNQVILPNNSAYAFTGTIIARQQAAGGNDFAAWEIKGAILRNGTAASTVLGSFNINTLSKTAGATAWVVTLTADTTNGGLAITVTGAAATNIRWVATVQTSEVTYS